MRFQDILLRTWVGEVLLDPRNEAHPAAGRDWLLLFWLPSGVHSWKTGKLQRTRRCGLSCASAHFHLRPLSPDLSAFLCCLPLPTPLTPLRLLVLGTSNLRSRIPCRHRGIWRGYVAEPKGETRKYVLGPGSWTPLAGAPHVAVLCTLTPG